MTAASDVTMTWQRHAAALFSFTSFAARRMKLGLAEVAALEQLQAGGPMTPGTLGKRLSMPSASVTALVDRLEYKRMIVRKANPSDRRGYLIQLTGTAMDKASLDLMPVARAMTEWSAELSLADRGTIVGYLDKVADILPRHQAHFSSRPNPGP